MVKLQHKNCNPNRILAEKKRNVNEMLFDLVVNGYLK